MAFYEIEFNYAGNAPTKSQTRNFCIEDLGYDQENVKAVSEIKVEIEGSSKNNIITSINNELPKKRTNTTYTQAS
ncbi:hypothetical protein HJP15_18840 [Pseudoalteromonas sp. NEC-BIFX-2020_002]|uniref:hypothetical protein n=1 Tax=Pseudoalteromonas sp. NEC-BIFX-2020_002 TaxID=2732353 RepID=UPI001476FE2D|nr:hypothetical protein [Pseudoalteromonas sp. NEC-BIFX-2020_002]NNG44948.1 hypothetical protein [Pseudoalteromonas sp. NEC-BIFX-2020_002]